MDSKPKDHSTEPVHHGRPTYRSGGYRGDISVSNNRIDKGAQSFGNIDCEKNNSLLGHMVVPSQQSIIKQAQLLAVADHLDRLNSTSK